ncbi:EamA-like transporter family protein [Yoonia tamlensis]|uniref:EamA-like transporter family protein n=1 Tax=Yoonia tamlensis TaxID=390270 RepID=A0A1I6G6D6_9RHOB|nr:DMT family transporter [Yoonia tamlensis]SFR37756.1 EamA-like transporter family protein [Yoonia tamlensis]
MDNFRGSILMVAAMLGFAFEDMFIKLIADALHVGQILMMLGAGGGIIFALIAHRYGDKLWSRDLLHPIVMIRNAGEIIGTFGFVTAIALTPISSASAILQATPLAVTIGAALFLGETVGWRRWLAVCIGLGGVLLVLRPGLDGFDANSLFAVQGVIGLAIRDLATRRVPAGVTSRQISTYAFLVLVPVGAVVMAFSGTAMVVPNGVDALRLVAAIVVGVIAYYMLVAATRIGQMSLIAPFRYTRLVFALTIGIVVFGETIDALTLIGAAIIVTSGIYTLWREARLRRSSLASQPAL